MIGNAVPHPAAVPSIIDINIIKTLSIASEPMLELLSIYSDTTYCTVMFQSCVRQLGHEVPVEARETIYSEPSAIVEAIVTQE